jgi:pimeloyl-ACP methyl ester carboxylesterase/DNA-binding CsgD family transcriptional regulator
VVRFTPGPVRVAYDSFSEGEQTLLVIPGWVSHLEYDWTTPEIRSFYERLASGRRVIRYDKRGLGLSDRLTGLEAYTLDTQVADALAVLDASGSPRVAIFAWSIGGPIALALAARYPDRVSHLILYGTYARALATPDYPIGLNAAVWRSLADLARAEWGVGTRAIADLFIPDSDPARLAWFTTYQRLAMSPQSAADFVEGAHKFDVRDLLCTVTAPTLVLHRRGDSLLPFALSEYLAEHLPQARLVELSGQHHTPYFGDSESLTQAVDGFLRVDATSQTTPQPLSQREIEVLRLVTDGLQNPEIAQQLCISPATVSRHLANIYGKLGVSTRSAATAHAVRSGIA